MDQVQAHDAQGLLLLQIVRIKHPDVENNFVGLGTGRCLEADPHPSVGIVGRFVRAGGNGVGKSEESSLRTKFLVQSLDEEIVLVVEHLAESLAADEPGALSIDCIREGHVVGRDRLGNCSCGSAHVEEATCHFLTRPNFGKSAVDRLSHVDFEGLLVGLHLKGVNHGSDVTERPIG